MCSPCFVVGVYKHSLTQSGFHGFPGARFQRTLHRCDDLLVGNAKLEVGEAVAGPGDTHDQVVHLDDFHIEVAQAAADPLGVTVLGPAPQALARLRNQHRWHLLLKGDNGAKVREVAAAALAWSEQKGRGRAKVMADVDPIEVL